MRSAVLKPVMVRVRMRMVNDERMMWIMNKVPKSSKDHHI